KTPVGIKVQGPSIDGIEQAGARIESVLSEMPQVRSVFAEKVAQGTYINIKPNRQALAKYGLTVANLQNAVAFGIGGENVAENIQGRERFPINVRYERAFRDNIAAMGGVLIGTPSGAQIPLSEVASISFSNGPAMIRDEGGALTGYIYIDLKGSNYGGFVDQANQRLAKLKLPPGYTFHWAGEYRFEQRAKQRLKLILPIVFLVILVLLYLVFRSTSEALMLIFPTIYALSGGLLLQWLLHDNFSVAVAVGYIDLFGIAVETAVVMLIYLNEALEKRIEARQANSRADLENAAIEGAVLRLRPKLMTVVTVIASLAPLLWESGIGSDVMRPIAAPIVGGMVTSSINVLILVPVFFVMLKERALKSGCLYASSGENSTSE
ncbi:MAG TPA: efflux RND transporter permease subunit, partial [Bryobacteraceae bacterium]